MSIDALWKKSIPYQMLQETLTVIRLNRPSNEALETQVQYLIGMALSLSERERSGGLQMLRELIEQYPSFLPATIRIIERMFPGNAADQRTQRCRTDIEHALTGCSRSPQTIPFRETTIASLLDMANEGGMSTRSLMYRILKGRNINGEFGSRIAELRPVPTEMESSTAE